MLNTTLAQAIPAVYQKQVQLRERSEGGQVGRRPGQAVGSAGLRTLVPHTVHFPHLPGSHRAHGHTCARPEPRCQHGRTERLGPGARLARAQQCHQIHPQKVTLSVSVICWRKHA